MLRSIKISGGNMKNIVSFLLIMAFLASLGAGLHAQILDSPRDGVYDKMHTPERKPIPYTPVRESDVVWQKRIWRIIDLRQKVNHPFYYPETPQKDWRNFMTVVMEAIREGTITAYDPTSDDQFLVPMTYQEIEAKFTRMDTVPIYDPNNPQRILRTEIVKEEFNSSDVERIKIKEDWFFDKQRSVMDVRIIGICPVINKYDALGNRYAFENMFWIYFPEARPVFAKTEIFNRQNGAERRTYDDIFWKRMFGSYIYKEENVYDRDIAEYAQGMDALLEAERVKEDLFIFEHELWEF
ncbi:MAG: gliding motility protein GldN [Bacteroidales bacterium]|nr:gliding motility protein GldN [Bacteroidales bacterium]